MEVDVKSETKPMAKSQESTSDGTSPTKYKQNNERATHRVFHACIHPFLSGFFGSIASLLEIVIRGILFIITLYMNSLMLKFFINSLKRNGATVAKVLSLSISFFMNGVISFFYFKEPFQVAWYFGLLLIMVGIYCLTLDKDKQDKLALQEIELVEATPTSKIEIDEKESPEK